MKVEDHRDQRDREHQAADDAKSQLEPNRIERDFVAEALSLPIAAIEIVRKDREGGAEEKFKHCPSPPLEVALDLALALDLVDGSAGLHHV